MLFRNEREICESLVPLGYHFGVLEDDGLGEKVCVSAFGIEADARDFVDYLQANGRAVAIVNLYDRIELPGALRQS